MSEMQRSSRGEHACSRQRELMAQLHDLLFPPPTTAASSSPLTTKVPAGGTRGRRKRPAREAAGRRRKKQGGSRTMVTTVPDFDGYQWRKYGQKHIEAAKHTRSYYRCTNSREQGCPAKRTVQRNGNGDGDGDGGGPPKYTVVYISEHTCNITESALAPPVILETTTAADVPAAAAESSTTAGSADVSPADSDITYWSGGGGGDTHAIPSEKGDFCHVFASDEWEHPTAALLQQEMEFAGPIRSPVHVEFGNWSYGSCW